MAGARRRGLVPACCRSCRGSGDVSSLRVVGDGTVTDWPGIRASGGALAQAARRRRPIRAEASPAIACDKTCPIPLTLPAERPASIRSSRLILATSCHTCTAAHERGALAADAQTRIQAAGSVHGDDTDDDGPLELIRPGKDNIGRIREQLERVPERCFDRRESPSILRFDFLRGVSVTDESA